MPGFNLSYNIPFYNSRSVKRAAHLQCNIINGQQFRLNRFVLNQFTDDKIFYEDDHFILLLDGVITNTKELQDIQRREIWLDCVLDLYNKDPKTFFSAFRGSFNGLIHDKRRNRWLIFNDHIGTKPLYLSAIGLGLFVSTEMTDHYHYFRQSKIDYQLDEDAAYMLLSYGFMLDDNTLCSKVKKLLPGHYVEINNGIVSFQQYYSLPETTMEGKLSSETNPDYIELIDSAFQKAITRQFEKDKQYGYKHLVALSGGLDSRMTSWVADTLGYKNQLNITFSQSDYLDETIPKQIAADLKHEWLFKALDNGNFLTEIDEITNITGGNLLYSGSAHANSMMKYLNTSNLGLLHSGQLGDVIVGTFITSVHENLKNVKPSGSYSNKYLDKIAFKSRAYTNQELFLMYQRGINGANNGLVITNQYTETMSPFYDLDFLELCLSLPVKLRLDHNLYKQWVLKKYPCSGSYVWEKTKRPVNFKSIYEVKYNGKSRPIENFPGIIKRKIIRNDFGMNTKKHMNPFDYWYETNGDLRNYFDTYFSENISSISGISETLHIDLIDLYKGNVLEKTQALSLLSAVRLFY